MNNDVPQLVNGPAVWSSPPPTAVTLSVPISNGSVLNNSSPAQRTIAPMPVQRMHQTSGVSATNRQQLHPSPSPLPVSQSSTQSTNANSTSTSTSRSPANSSSRAAGANSGRFLLEGRRVAELAREMDPNLQLDEEVEEALLQLLDDFLDGVVNQACRLAKHRSGTTLEARDVSLVLERHWQLSVPGFGAEDYVAAASGVKNVSVGAVSGSLKRPLTSEAHRQRLNLIRKAAKKL